MNFRQIKQKELKEQSRELKDFISNPLLCDLLALRQIDTPEDAKKFLEAKNQPLSGLDVFSDANNAIKRIKDAIKNEEKILVWGDFDADGVTSSALMHKTLQTLGANFEIFIPNRENHGHGLNAKEALKLVSKDKVKVLITVDCGISNTQEINLLKSLGVDVIITDHHKLEGKIPDAYAILNPQSPNSLRDDLPLNQIKDLSRLAGVGVAYKLACELLCDNKKVLDELLILACVGTISDVVPLLGENRTIVTRGLELINQKKHKGISMLFESSGRQNITSTDVAFILTPRINAVGRLSTPDLAFEFLTSDNESALNFALEKLDNFNKIRQSLCENMHLEARDMVLADKNAKNESAVVIYKEDWHIGIIGIVASKLAEEFLKPVFIITSGENNQGRCSIRSVEGFNVYEILKKNADLFLGFGGHSLAGGFSFDMTMHPYEEIKKIILETVEECPSTAQITDYLEADMFIEPKDINKSLLETVDMLEPFGQDNPPPLFALKDATLVNSKVIGKNANHLKFTCQKDGFGFECVKWNEGELKIPPNSTIDTAFFPRLNIFNNQETIQLNIEDVYCADYKPQKKQSGLKIYDHRKKTGILNQISDYLKRDGIDITVWAKKIKTLDILKKYPEIQKRFCPDEKKCEAVMFFDYPSSYDELREILVKIKPNKIHLMNDNFDENIENYIKTISGMLKYSHNQKDGTIDIEKMARATGLSEAFIQIALEIFESCNSIEILDVDKIKYIEPVSYEKISNHAMFEILNEEFIKITEFKKHLAEDDIDKMSELINSCVI